VTVHRAHLPNPVHSNMEMMDLHIGCVAQPGSGKRAVAIMLQKPTALITEAKAGTLVESWPEVIEIIGGLIDQATVAWGKASVSEAQMIYLGLLHGSLGGEEGRQSLIKSLRQDKRVGGHIALLHAALTSAMTEAGMEGLVPPPASCAECGKTSTRDGMWALYCLGCAEAAIAKEHEDDDGDA